MQKIILVIAAVFLVTSAGVGGYAQNTEKKSSEKKEGSTADAWRQALPTNEQSSNPPVIEMEESINNVETKETPEQIETRVLELEGRLTEALKGRNAAALKQLLADDFVPAAADITEPQADKTRFIEWTLKKSALKSYLAEKTRVRVFSPTTVLVTSYYTQPTVAAGVTSDADFMVTNVWVKRKKQWQTVSRHVTQLPKIVMPVSRPAQAMQNP